jgi:Rrf2 family cysteine metabolism transcriptional repressor
MIELGSRFGKGPVLLREIAKSEEISEKYLSQLVIPLRGRGLLTTFRGVHGGYVLGKSPIEITLKEIVEPLEGDLSLVDATERPESDVKASEWVTRGLWSALGNKISEFLNSYTLEDLVRMRDDKQASEVNYNI